MPLVTLRKKVIIQKQSCTVVWSGNHPEVSLHSVSHFPSISCSHSLFLSLISIANTVSYIKHYHNCNHYCDYKWTNITKMQHKSIWMVSIKFIVMLLVLPCQVQNPTLCSFTSQSHPEVKWIPVWEQRPACLLHPWRELRAGGRPAGAGIWPARWLRPPRRAPRWLPELRDAL